MGAALDWLSENERQYLAQEILPGSKFINRRVSALCPFHGEKTASFGYSPDKDVFHCFGCNASGDLIKLWGHITQPGLNEAEVFKAFKRKYGPDDVPGSWSKPRPRQRPKPQPETFDPPARDIPPALWRERAGLFCQHSMERLQNNRRELDRLVGYGLDPEGARATRLGWNDRIKAIPRKSWGLDEGKKPIYLYPGLVIPLYEGGEVIKIKIRRPDGSQPRFMAVDGSCMRLSIYGRTDSIMVVESERDAAMLWWRFGTAGWSFLATASATARPCSVIHKRLLAAQILAVSLDNDIPGTIAWLEFWRGAYTNSFHWPLPKSWKVKDPGAAAQAGLDLTPWLNEAVAFAAEKAVF